VSRRPAVIALLVLVAAAAAYYFLVRDRSVAPAVRVAQPAATLGDGSEGIVIGSAGRAIPWYPLSEQTELPALPDAELPRGGRLRGPMLEQARVLGAVPRALRPYVERSYYGESGVDVVLDSGIELRFGDASQAARKWKAAAAVLADPTIVALDYVDLRAPGRASTGGSGHLLPPPP
jgi:hypothetical protein